MSGTLPETGTGTGILLQAGTAVTATGVVLLAAGLLWRRRRSKQGA